MGVLDTTYTFQATDTITSSKLNNIIDQTTFTGDAIQGTTLQVVSPGKLAVNAGGVTSNELASGAVTQAKLGTNVVGNGPAFFVRRTTNQALANNSVAVVQFDSKDYDTASAFNTSTYRFTPNVAGYYQINLSCQIDYNTVGSLPNTFASIYKNGSIFHDVGIISIPGSQVNSLLMSGSALIYMNGTTDYIQATASIGSGTATSAVILGASPTGRTYMSGFLARSA
jgi:hypothetical protein